MNLKNIRSEKETEELILSITKNYETLIQQNRIHPQETLEFKMSKPRETFRFNPPIQINGDWMIGLVSIVVYNSISNITEENNNFQLYIFPDEKNGGVSYIKVRDEIEKDLDISDITAADIQDDIVDSNIIEEYREQVTKRMEGVGYANILAGYPSSVLQDFESYLRTNLTRLKVIFDWFWKNLIQVLLLMKYDQVFTLLKIFPKLFIIFSKLNIQDLVT